ncbi:MAG TPA: hypothetical protein VGM88_06075 [Kofleriaceae bacterium]|jgi:hypothetical protein
MARDEAEAERIRRWRRGMELAAERSREAFAAAGPQPEQAVREAKSAYAAAKHMGLLARPRDPVSQAAIDELRERWARVKRRADAGR